MTQKERSMAVHTESALEDRAGDDAAATQSLSNAAQAAARRSLRQLIYREFNADAPGSSRTAATTAGSAPERILRVDADFAIDGAWTGVRDIVELAYLAFRARGLDADIARHNYALNRVLAGYRGELPLKHASLTDTAQGSERTRNFPLDRAYRLVNGLVDMILQWKGFDGGGQRWAIAVEGFDRAQHLSRRFFAELARRGAAAGIEVSVDTAMNAEALAAWMPRMALAPSAMSAEILGPKPSAAPELGDEERRAIEQRLTVHDIEPWEAHYPRLLAHYRKTGNAVRCAEISMRALCICNHYGYYYESASFADGVLTHLDTIARGDEAHLWNCIGNLYTGLVTTGREEDALRMLLERADPVLTRMEFRAKMHYLLSMTYLRYLKTPDIAKSEAHILKASEAIEAAKDQTEPANYVFLKVFIDNGLAFLRVRQGRQAEALALCQSGYALLTRELGDDKHRLHRSVLQYNTAQVYVMLNRADEAIEHYRKSMEMDPYYSEYYNEVGNIFQRMERFEEAKAMYDLAIEYSAPYPEVHFNRGICRLHLDMTEQALEDFDLSLELNPEQPELYAMRAELREEFGRTVEALSDYDAAISLSADSIPARVNRAVLHYNDGRYEQALADMDHVISIDGDEGSHYLNRAEIHKAMRQEALYLQDLSLAAARGGG
jgi:tetratricopeptide (TPR) repeat protein